MSKVASGTALRVAPQVYDAIRALLRAGRNDEAIVKLCAITVIRPDDLDTKELLFDAFFQKRDWLPALALAEELVRRRSDIAGLQKALIATLSNMKRYDEVIVKASQYIERYGEDITIIDALKVANFYTGKIDEAIRYGQRGIELHDAEAAKIPRTTTIIEPGGPPSGQNIISFSLWGPAPVYGYGAMINLALCRTIYPGWTCRFYVDATVPQPCVANLRDNGGDVRRMEDEYPGVGQFQRFLVMNDPTVGRFLVRDCDARVSAAEADLVRRWIEGGYPFHVIRGHVLHNELMLAGLWAGRTDCRIDIVALMKHYFAGEPIAKYGQDQRMLGHMLWPLIRNRCLVHDKYYRLEGVHTVEYKDPQGHFGAGHQSLAAVLKEAEQLGIPRVL
jgi:tetratricopeptide (TPR) repeat protein